MSKTQAEIKAKIYNAFVKHPHLNYREIETTRDQWAVGQFIGEKQVAVVLS